LKQTVQWYRENADWVEGVRRGEYLTYYAKYYENRTSSLEAVLSAGGDPGVFRPAGKEKGSQKGRTD